MSDVNQAKSLFDQFVAVFQPSTPEDQPADVYAYYNLMLRAQAAFRDMQGRWDSLAAWGIDSKMPSVKPTIDAWISFEKTWTMNTNGGAFAGLADMAAEREAASDLLGVEMAAQKLGFRAGDKIELAKVPSKEEQDQAVVDVTTGVDNAFARANLTIDQKQRQAEELARQAAQKIKDLPSSIWESIPWYVKLGGAVVGVAIVVDAVRR